MAKEKVNYQEVYDLYQLCSETKDLREFCAEPRIFASSVRIMFFWGMEVKQPEGEPPIKWVKLQLTSGATLFLRNTTVLDLSLLLNKMIG